MAGQQVAASDEAPSHGSSFLLVGFGLFVAFAVAAVITVVLLRRRRREDDDDDARAPTSGSYGGGGLPHRETGYNDVNGYGGRSYGGFGGAAPADATALVYGDVGPDRSPGYPAPYSDPYAATTYSYPSDDRGQRRTGYGGPAPEVRPPAYGGTPGYASHDAGGAGGAPDPYGTGYGGAPAYDAGQGYAGGQGHAGNVSYPGGFDANGYDANGYDRNGYTANDYAGSGTSTGYDAGHGFGAQDPRWGEVADPPAPAQRQPYEESMTERAGRHGASDAADEPGSVNGWQGDGYGGYPDESWGYQPR